MNGNPAVIQALQAAAAAEAHLNLQYRLDWRSLTYMGVKKTARRAHAFGDDAHDWLKLVADRILFLGGKLSYAAGTAVEQDTFTGVLQNQLALEIAILEPYEAAIQTAARALDDGTRNLFEHLIKWHQRHVAWLERQLRLIAGFEQETGETRYIEEKI